MFLFDWIGKTLEIGQGGELWRCSQCPLEGANRPLKKTTTLEDVKQTVFFLYKVGPYQLQMRLDL